MLGLAQPQLVFKIHLTRRGNFTHNRTLPLHHGLVVFAYECRLFCTCAHLWCRVHIIHHVKFLFQFRQLGLISFLGSSSLLRFTSSFVSFSFFGLSSFFSLSTSFKSSFFGRFYFSGCLLKLPIFAVQKATAPKNGVEFRQGSICAIRSSLPTSCDIWRRRTMSPISC